MRQSAFALIALALAASAADARDSADKPNAKGEAELAQLVSGRVAGPPQRCIVNSETMNPRIIEGTAIVYDFGRTIWVNRPRGNVFTLREDDILVTDVWGSQICSLDKVRTVEPVSRFPHSIMTLGEFVPYVKPPKR